MRASLYIQGEGGERVVIDTGPEFRLQALAAGIERLDAVLLTHAHADHIHGMDDLRVLTREKPLPLYANADTIREMRERFSYVFQETQRGGGKPRIAPEAIEAPFVIGNLRFSPVPVKHGVLDILGWRITEILENAGPRDALAVHTVVYLTDTSAIPESSWQLIRNADTLIIGAIRVQPHETHFSFQQAMETAERAGGRRMYITHISHDLNHRKIEEICRKFREDRGLKETAMGPAWDGLELSIPFP
jgi:phosphoribosyl 1,2-cyclic phosphate phosphodiesterase